MKNFEVILKFKNGEVIRLRTNDNDFCSVAVNIKCNECIVTENIVGITIKEIQ